MSLPAPSAPAPEAGFAASGGIPALSVRGLSVSFVGRDGTEDAVSDVDLQVAPGELVALLGESGSGKSVTARAIMGLSAPTARVRAAELRLGDTDLLAAPEARRRALRGERMSLVFQDALSALNPVLSVGDQLTELQRAHRRISRKQARQRAVELLGLVGIPAPAKRVGDYPHQFSGGMRQRILMAMAVALDPELLIADEPTTALDVTVQAQILDLLERLRTELGMGVLLITHDLGVVCEVADRVVVMYAGRVVDSGDADSVLTRPAHPYTEALLRSVPDADVPRDELVAIPGSPPTPSARPSGCAFHPRCTWRVDVCRTERPALIVVAPGQATACHRHEEVLRAAAG